LSFPSAGPLDRDRIIMQRRHGAMLPLCATTECWSDGVVVARIRTRFADASHTDMRFRVPVMLVLALGLAACGGSGVSFVDSGTSALDTSDSYANSRYYEVWTFRADQGGTSTFGMNSPDFQPHLEIEDEN